MKNYLILGANSAIAKYFINRLRNEGNTVFTVSSCNGMKQVYSESSIKNIINKSTPHVIINFAGTFTNNFSKSYDVNVLISKNIFDAALKAGFDGKIILIGSAAEYGAQDKYVEYRIGKPKSVYGLTKLMQHSLFQYYVGTTQIKAKYIRLFNVVYEQIDDLLFIGNFTKQVKRVLKRESNKIKLGNLNWYRDFLLIDDVYTGFMKIIEMGNSGEVYNLGMGKSILLNEFVQLVLSSLNLHPKLVTKEINSVGNLQDNVFADIAKTKNIGWSPKFNYKNLIKEYCKRLQTE